MIKEIKLWWEDQNLKKGVKVHTAFKIYPFDKARVQAMADKLDMSLSSYINKAVLEKVERDEKSEN